MRTTLAAPALALATLAATVLAGVAATGAATAAAAPAPTALRLGQLPRGADVAGPHVEGRTLVDGDVRVTIRSDRLALLGRSGAAYVVLVDGRRAAADTVQRVRADGSARVLATLGPRSSGTVLSDDGSRVVETRNPTDDASVVTVRSARSGRVLDTRRFPGYLTLLAASRSEVLVSEFDTGTRRWDTTADSVTRLTRRFAGLADYATDRLATYTGDPYQGGCQVLSRLSDPSVVLWTSCRERVTGFSPDGARMSTVGILSDGIGPNEVAVRKVRGAELARYTTTSYFGEVRWETDRALLLDTVGRKRAATVRCELQACELATDLGPAPAVRPAG